MENNSRRVANFPPTLWGCSFASFSFPQKEFETYTREVDVLKDNTKDMLRASKNDPVENIQFINLLCRLGVSYHFEKEIENNLKQIFHDFPNLLKNHDYDLYTVSVVFRVFRQHGYKLPCDYMKVLYRAILNLFKETENEMSKQGRSYAAYYVKEEFKDLVGAYHVEAQWAAKGHVPTFDEYVRNGLTTTVYGVIMAASFLGMEEVAGVEEYEWLKSNPKIVRAGKMIGRLMNDIVSHEV
ncbi:unnamed protein product [Dovyalis caffra]|uniref:Terpene synthase metal-binding domain-containing protein n=1 Tax=Dovyalis caffra TaxID=77055 RepID=A0AAV1SJH0_9ROSI|nr:unnamed protein product [Dovyalis caffra]